uniref:ATP-binding protein n=1 Tax=Nonomuraea sp. CA-252377 TaxID=3240003 RepID=UPI003F49A751
MKLGFPAGTDARYWSASRVPSSRLFLLPLAPEACQVARRYVQETLIVWRLPDVVESARLLASELVKNAVQHASGWSDSDLPVRLLLTYVAGTLRIEVHDPDARHLPVWRVPAKLSEFGYGVPLMNAIADRRGVRIFESGKAVWCEVDRCAAFLIPLFSRSDRNGSSDNRARRSARSGEDLPCRGRGKALSQPCCSVPGEALS